LPPVETALDRVIGIGPAPLLAGEQGADYREIARRIVQASGPRDALEEFLLRDVIDLTWEILRLRRAKAGLIRSSMNLGVHKILIAAGYSYPDADTFSHNWAAGDKHSRQEFDKILKKAGLTMEEVTAKTFGVAIDRTDRPNVRER
jgi:hypothetical protein